MLKKMKYVFVINFVKDYLVKKLNGLFFTLNVVLYLIWNDFIEIQICKNKTVDA